MPYDSIHDNYYRYIRKDAEYYHKWLQQYGTECVLKVPKTEDNERIRDIELAYGASTYANTHLNYKEYRIHAIIQPQDFTKIENGIETQMQIVTAIKLDDGYVIEFRKLNKIYSFQVVAPPEQYWEMLFRGTINLIRVEESENLETMGLDDLESLDISSSNDRKRNAHSSEYKELDQKIKDVIDSLSTLVAKRDMDKYLVTKANLKHEHPEYISSNVFKPMDDSRIKSIFNELGD